MKRLFLVLLASALLLGCVAQAPANTTNNTQIANPASVFCEARGGTLSIETAADGSQTGYCTLATGERCEEWAYYRGECPVASPTPSPQCGGHDLGSTWKQDCNSCSCTTNGAVCTTMACVTPSPSTLPSPSPSPEALIQAPDDFAKLKDYEQHYLRIYLGDQSFTMQMELYQGYYLRWTGDYKPRLSPNSYSIELRKNNDFMDAYGQTRVKNGVQITWTAGASTQDVHWIEFKCGAYQFWSQTPLMNDSVFDTFANVTTYACSDYLANK